LRKRERLDQILIRLGYATKGQIEEAVNRQRQEGGRFGSNLIELGAVSEEELFDALVEQFRVPTIAVDDSTVNAELLERMPPGALEESLIVPVGWNESLGVLSVAVANPGDEAGIEKVRAAFGAKKVRVSLAPESVLADLVIRLTTGATGEDGDAEGPEGRSHGSRDVDGVQLVALPELFDSAPEEEEVEPSADDRAIGLRVIMVTRGGSRRNFLPAVFKPEGFDLIVVQRAEEVKEALLVGAASILVSNEMEGEFREWIRIGEIPQPDPEVTVFSSVSGAMLQNPAPYRAMVTSVRASVQAIAEYRAVAEGVAPPYRLMTQDVEALADRVGLGRVATDGTVVGMHLLMPVEKGTSIDPFRSFSATMELAHRIRFPWPIDKLLGHCLGLYLGRVELDRGVDPKEEVLLAAQVLALVWFRHNLLTVGATDPEQALGEMRTGLRSLAGRFATLDVVEAYLDAIAERGSADSEAAPMSVLLVGGERITRALEPALTRVGSVVASAKDAAAAQAHVDANGPDAIVVDHAGLGGEVQKICAVLRLNRGISIFVLTDATDPTIVLNLLDIGVDDVFGPPHDFDLTAARIHRAIRARGTSGTGARGQFSAKFDAFSFLDLAQMLANGMKNVRVDMRRGNGEEARLFLERGRPVHATCGSLEGAAAVYYVISWEDDGEFTVHEVSDFPAPNLAESIESLLMEGVRLLDESRA